MRRIFLIKALCFLALFFILSGNALAHKVTVFAWVEGDKVYGESKFSGGKKAQRAEVIAWDTEGNELLRTRTDENGEFSFPVPKKTGMRIELIAGMGHKGEWTIPIEELAGSDASAEVDKDKVSEKQTASTNSTASTSPQSGVTETYPKSFTISDRAEFETIIEKSVEKALDKRMKPLMVTLADMEQKGPSFNEVVGGIGYIFGLMGVALYFKSRQKKG